MMLNFMLNKLVILFNEFFESEYRLILITHRLLFGSKNIHTVIRRLRKIIKKMIQRRITSYIFFLNFHKNIFITAIIIEHLIDDTEFLNNLE